MKILGGRPMKLLPIDCFIDRVNHMPVYYWVDTMGRYWMAHGPWSLFRVAFDYADHIETPTSYELERMYNR